MTRGIVIGTDDTTGEEVGISPQAQAQGLISLVGVSGSGKTTVLEHMILQRLEAGEGLTLVEPHGDLTKAIIAKMPERRLKDVVLLDLLSCGTEAFGINLFACPTPRTSAAVATTASQVMHIFERVWHVGPETAQLAMCLRHVTAAIMDAGATFTEIPLLLQEEGVREHLVARVKNPHTRAWFAAYNRRSPREQRELTASLLNKVDAYVQEGIIANIVSQERSTVDFRRIMDTGKVLLVLLSPQLEEISRLVGSMVVAGILRAAFSRADTPEGQRRGHMLVVDEFQHFCSQDFATLTHEARKWHLSPVVLSHQALGQLDQASLAAVAGAVTRIVFRVSGDDSSVICKSFDRKPTSQIVGEEPLRSPANDVLSSLLHRGHTHPLVNQWVREYALPLESLQRQFGMSQFAFAFGCAILNPGDLIDGQRLLNEALAEANQAGRADVFIHPLALMIVGGATDREMTKIFYPHFNPPDISFLAGTASLDFQGLQPSAKAFGRPGFRSEAGLAAFVAEATRPRWYHRLFGLTPQVPAGVTAFVRLLRSLRAVLEILAAEPIMVDTGRYREKVQPRLYSDMEGEISNLLSNLPPYHAKVKLPSGEHLLRTHPPRPSPSDEMLAERLTRIKRQMRFLGYTRPAAEIAEEVRKRHERLQGGSEKPPRRRRKGDQGEGELPPPTDF